MAFSNTFDTAAPDGNDDPGEADNNMRRIQAAVQERENVDHYWPLTGTEVSDADAGEHRKATLRTGAAPSAVADKGFVYAKDVSGKAELFYIDEDGNEVQLTSAGKILSASLDMKDEDDMVSNSATHVATQQSIKAFAESEAAAVDSADDFTPSAYVGGESVALPNGLILKFGTSTIGNTTTKDITYGTAFPTAGLFGFAIDRLGDSLANQGPLGAGPKSGSETTVLQVENDNGSGTRTFQWLAIGY